MAWLRPPLRNMRYVMHLGLTGMITWWAVILAYPASTFATSKSYTEFARICPDEDYWALGFGITAIVGCVGCWAAWPARIPTRLDFKIKVFSAILLGLNHGMIALLTAKANPVSTGTGIYAIVMLMAYLLAVSEVDRIE